LWATSTIRTTNDCDSGTTTSTDNKAVNDGDTINNMPGNLRTAFTNRYPTAVVEKWKTETENNQQVYEVEFKQGTLKRKPILMPPAISCGKKMIKAQPNAWSSRIGR
jgi:hypothetical protein